MTTIRWGMIGAGDVTEVKSGPAFSKADDSVLVAVMRRNAELAADYARRHGVERSSGDADDIILADDIDAVYIATPTSSHHEYALRAAAAGKHVYVEKPMAMTPAECEGMIAACEAAGVKLWVGYYRRALPRFLKVKELLDSGAIGDVRAVTSQVAAKLPANPAPTERDLWRVDPAASGGAFFFEGACHTLDMLDFLFGPIAEVRGFAANQAGAWPAEDLVTTTYRFDSGILGSGVWAYATDHHHELNEIIGSEGRLQYSIVQPKPIRLLRGKTVEEFPVDDPEHVHQPMIQSIGDELNGRGQAASTGETAARTARVMEQALADLR